jgi:uncharacterized protein YegP (UPF0339 family)
MVFEDYLPCSAYEGQATHSSEVNFTSFYDESSQRYFFALLDADGKVLLKSEGYPQAAARENGIQSVIKNRQNKGFFSVKEENGQYFLSLRAANHREIARSCSMGSEAEALALVSYATGEEIRGGATASVATTVKERSSNREDDNYLACTKYAGHSNVGVDGKDGMVKFQQEGGEYYFAWYDADGSVLMRSEGYPTTGARDNGFASVAKNRELEERYSVIERMGRFFVILKAGNHQEIARSCPYASEAAARALFPSQRAASGATLASSSLSSTTTGASESVTTRFGGTIRRTRR